jgi:hypothetical protein
MIRAMTGFVVLLAVLMPANIAGTALAQTDVVGLRRNADGSLTELPASPTRLPAGSVALDIVV